MYSDREILEKVGEEAIRDIKESVGALFKEYASNHTNTLAIKGHVNTEVNYTEDQACINTGDFRLRVNRLSLVVKGYNLNATVPQNTGLFDMIQLGEYTYNKGFAEHEYLELTSGKFRKVLLDTTAHQLNANPLGRGEVEGLNLLEINYTIEVAVVSRESDRAGD